MILKSILHSVFAQKAKIYVERMRYLSPDVYKRHAHVGNALIAGVIQSGDPAAIGKLGSTELQSLRGYLRCRWRKTRDTKTAFYRRILLEYSGVYPSDYETFSKWGAYWVTDVLPNMTHIGAWFNLNESWIVRRYARNAKVFHSYGLEPYIFDAPWSFQLTGKKVVVVSPFSQSILHQYPSRGAIWRAKPEVLPDFDLRTVQCPTYPHLAQPKWPDWFASLDDMKRQIGQAEFDVLLVGAGAYSLPLCTFAKSLGKVGIHLGGNLQLMFGILGKRWLVNNASIDHRFFNDAWIYPMPVDTPVDCTKVEGGCYWK